MFKRGLASMVVLAVASVANAGALVDLRLAADETGTPISAPNADGSWNGGESLVVEYWFTASQNFNIRSAQIDYRASSPELILGKETLAFDGNLGMNVLDGVPNFWFDYTRSVVGLGTYPFMGNDVNDLSTAADYVDFSNLLAGDPLAPFPPAMVSGRQANSATRMIEVVAGVPIRLGGMPVTLPQAGAGPRVLTLDLLSSVAGDPNAGSSIGFGFGTATDPIRLWSTAGPGQHGSVFVDDAIAYAPGRAGGPIQFTVVPEPATLAFLALGGLAALRRRRRKA